MLDVLRDKTLRDYWLPVIGAGLAAWLIFLTIGDTPVVRASGLALVIVGVTLTLRRWGALLAATGGLALALSPAFWSQTGGADRFDLLLMLVALGAAVIGAVAVAWFSKRPSLGLALAVIIFAVLFLTVISEPGSLRLTTGLAAWLLFLLVDALMLTNPRPDEATPISLRRRHIYGILLLLIIGVMNDALFVLFVPAIMLGLALSKTRLPVWYWLALIGVAAYGIYDLADIYLDSAWWTYPAAEAQAQGLEIPRMLGDGWREPARWLELFALVTEQFTIFGLLLGVFGLARLTRWYPPLGGVTLVAYASYFLFGLLYFGRDSAVLLLPLLMIQMIWLAYAVFTLGQWLQRSFQAQQGAIRWVAPAVFTLLPLVLLLRVTGVM